MKKQKTVTAGKGSLRGHSWGTFEWECPCGFTNHSMADRNDTEIECECSTCGRVITVTEIFLT